MSNTNEHIEFNVTKEEFRAHLERQIEGMEAEFTKYCKTIKRMEKYDKEDQEGLEEARTVQRELFYGIVVNQVTLHNINVAWSHVEKHIAAD